MPIVRSGTTVLDISAGDALKRSRKAFWIGKRHSVVTPRMRFDEDGVRETKESQHCAGALIFLERLERPNQWMRWMERIGYYDHTKLDMDSPVCGSVEEFIEVHDRRSL